MTTAEPDDRDADGAAAGDDERPDAEESVGDAPSTPSAPVFARSLSAYPHRGDDAAPPTPPAAESVVPERALRRALPVVEPGPRELSARVSRINDVTRGAPTTAPGGSSGQADAAAHHPRWRSEAALRIALAAFGFLAVISTYSGIGWSWDESYYLPAARLAHDWGVRAIAGNFKGGPASPAAIDAYWGGPRVIGEEEAINELPSVCKWMWAASLLLFESWLGPIVAMRLPSALAFALTLVLLYQLCRLACPPPAALVGALAYAAMPRVFGHAHLGATETITVLMTVAVTYAFARGVQSAGWAVACGVLFGVALATKINAFFLFPALFAWAFLFHRARLASPVAAMLVLGPPLFVLLWPWLWHQPPVRILEYLKFHATHQETATWYLGAKWGYDAPSAPWHYPFVMLTITTPPVVLALIGLGAARWLVRRREAFPALLAIQALVPILIIAMPGQPKYDGVRLFLPAMPFLAAFAAYGVAGLLRQFDPAEERTPPEPRRLASMRRARTAILALAFGGLGVSAVVSHSYAHPFYLSYFNALAGDDGGLPGAWERGMEVTYWGESVNADLLAWLNDEANVPRGAALKTRALFPRVLRDYQAWGMLRDDLLIDELPPGLDGRGGEGAARPFDFHLIQSRRGFWGAIDWRFFAAAPRTARFTISHHGVPLLFVHGPVSELP